jgi:hypothetical protein
MVPGWRLVFVGTQQFSPEEAPRELPLAAAAVRTPRRGSRSKREPPGHSTHIQLRQAALATPENSAPRRSDRAAGARQVVVGRTAPPADICVKVGFGRTAVSEIESPNLLVNRV